MLVKSGYWNKFRFTQVRTLKMNFHLSNMILDLTMITSLDYEMIYCILELGLLPLLRIRVLKFMNHNE